MNHRNASRFTASERNELCRVWMYEKKPTGMKLSEFAQTHGVERKIIANWVYNRIKNGSLRCCESGQKLVRIASKEEQCTQPSLKIEYHGARISVGSRYDLALLLSVLGGLGDGGLSGNP